MQRSSWGQQSPRLRTDCSSCRVYYWCFVRLPSREDGGSWDRWTVDDVNVCQPWLVNEQTDDDGITSRCKITNQSITDVIRFELLARRCYNSSIVCHVGHFLTTMQLDKQFENCVESNTVRGQCQTIAFDPRWDKGILPIQCFSLILVSCVDDQVTNMQRCCPTHVDKTEDSFIFLQVVMREKSKDCV